MAISYYDILGVAEDANEEAIRNGYLKAMRDKHPDLHSGDDASADTQKIQGDRGLMGDGCIDLPAIQVMIDSAGFTEFHEVEVFSDQYWNADQAAYLELILMRYRELMSAVAERADTK